MALVGDKSDRLCSMSPGDEITQRVEDFASTTKTLEINIYSSKIFSGASLTMEINAAT